MTTPRQVVQAWVDAFNRADVETLASLYTEDAVNHQVVFDPKGLRGCGFFNVVDGRIRFQRGYWDRLSFQQQQGR